MRPCWRRISRSSRASASSGLSRICLRVSARFLASSLNASNCLWSRAVGAFLGCQGGFHGLLFRGLACSLQLFVQWRVLYRQLLHRLVNLGLLGDQLDEFVAEGVFLVFLVTGQQLIGGRAIGLDANDVLAAP